MADSDDAVIRIDSALKRLYKLKGRTDYENDDGVGKFAEFCEENGFEDEEDTFKEEFDAGPDQCTFCDMEDAFPWLDSDANRNKKIFDILKRCWEEEGAYSKAADDLEPLKLSQSHWQIKKEDLVRAKQQMREQCPNMCNEQFLQDQVLLTVIAVGMKVDKPYLQWLVDMYTRERLYHHARKRKTGNKKYTVADWVAQNKHLKDLGTLKEIKVTKGSNQNPKDLVKGAVASFQKRIAPSLMLKPPMKIKDSLRQISYYIAATVDFVGRLTDDQEQSCPFQYDSVYAFDHVEMAASIVKIEDPDDESDDDDSDSDHQAEDEQKNDVDDPFGALKDKLSGNGLPMHAVKIGDHSKKDMIKPARAFNENFKVFREKHMKDVKDYPRKQRFVSVVDRRAGDKAKGTVDDDEVVFYAPPAGNCRKLPAPVHPFYFFDAARTCIVPDHVENEEKFSEQGGVQQAPTLNRITSLNLKKGIMLSFHCLSADEIRCYIYLNSQGMRFMPEDILHLLPIFFDSEYSDNAEWPKSDEAKQLVKEMEKNLRDDGFSAFFREYKTQEKPV